ncbi:MAG: hypothetical protein LBI99_02465 [Propionibacteriaceae bacterium]|jgi:hypothetical protein|nr:hypothetical protein [Propionibacteriaceae bacterium]
MRARRLFALSLLPLLLVLAGCVRFEMDVVISADESVQLNIVIGVERDAAETMGVTADTLCTGAGGGEGTFSDISDDKYIACRLSVTGEVGGSSADGVVLTHEDGVYTFRFSTAELTNQVGNEIDVESIGDVYTDFAIRVSFPGEVVDYNQGAELQGANTVAWTDPKVLTSGGDLIASGRDTPSDEASPAPGKATRPSAPGPSDAAGAGPNWLLIGGIALGAVLVAALVAVLAVRAVRSKKRLPAPPPAYPPQYAPQPYGGQANTPTQPYPTQPYPTQPYAPQSYGGPANAPTQPYPAPDSPLQQFFDPPPAPTQHYQLPPDSTQPYPTQPYPDSDQRWQPPSQPQ